MDAVGYALASQIPNLSAYGDLSVIPDLWVGYSPSADGATSIQLQTATRAVAHAADGHLYFVGVRTGNNLPGNLYRTLGTYAWNLSTNTGRWIPAPGFASSSSAVVYVMGEHNGLVYIAISSAAAGMNGTWTFSLVNETFTQISTVVPNIYATQNANCVKYQGKFYLITEGASFVRTYDIATGIYSGNLTVSGLNANRYMYATITGEGRYAFIFGGANSSGMTAPTKYTQRIDLANLTTTPILNTGIPELSSEGTSFIESDHSVLFIPGYAEASRNNASRSVWRLDIATEKWSHLGLLPDGPSGNTNFASANEIVLDANRHIFVKRTTLNQQGSAGQVLTAPLTSSGASKTQLMAYLATK